MKKYKVIVRFVDLKDNNHIYHVGDVYPHAGKEVSEARINELKGSDNKRGVPLIEEVADEVATKPVEEPKVETKVEEPVATEAKTEEKIEEEPTHKKTTSRKKK